VIHGMKPAQLCVTITPSVDHGAASMPDGREQ